MSEMLVDSGKKLKIKFPQEDQDKQFNWYLYYDTPVHEAPYYRKVSERVFRKQNRVPDMFIVTCSPPSTRAAHKIYD
jgi:hypothetical protein